VSGRLFVVYDSRAISCVDDAAIMETCGGLAGAVAAAPSHGACVVYSYADDGRELTDERLEWSDPSLAAPPKGGE